MDAVGFAFGTAILAAAFTVFGILDRLIVGVADEIRYSVGPGMISGVRAWAQDAHTVGNRASTTDGSGGDGPAGDDEAFEIPDAVPVAPVRTPGRAWHLFGALLGLRATRAASRAA